MLLIVLPLLLALGAAAALAAIARHRARLARAETQRLRTRVAEHAAPRDALAHEIRTPLSLIRASAELLAEETPGDLNEVQRRFVATILDNTEQAIGMAEDFLTQARLDHELFTLHLESVELRRLVRTLIQEMRRTVAAPMRLQEHGAPIRMVADRRLLRQAIANTVTNAVRHAGEHATITISVSSEEDTALITVADNGRGMTRAQREALFTPFRSQNSLEAPVSRGVGLGMVVTKQILTLHGGSVLVDSLASRGTSVYLTLPIRPSVSNGLEPGSPGEGGRTTPDADPASKHE
ncbi:sensor histidine kinase [Actinomyces sp. oral taxon 448]|uniref:sensor histidine kinase n=1 Tax=Actinomyces sp. oral taxon 448 TaxID=712124 RepID=UPI000218A2A1|nr:HAMP domain-containing sensor histidine kinase [Actinomyces sp. oral taxon 448]EGQ75132.1 sensor histidine kinase [Actinomyces sp. oral taxon 448 str. F0400]